MAFSDDLLRHVDQIKLRVPHIRGEEATKHALVIPLLQVLGYEVFDPREVQPEYIADFAKKKASGQMEKIDYAIWLNAAPVIFIECKAVDAKLDDHDGQLARYFNATPSVKVAILTNGIRLKVFGDLQQPNMMDPTPWLDVDLLSPKAAEVDALQRFRKVDFSAEEVVGLAEQMVYFNKMSAYISAQLRDPSEPFVRWIAAQVGAADRVTAKVIERLTPILRKAIQAAILDNVAKSFATPEVPGPAPAPVPAPATTAVSTTPPDPEPQAGAGAVTTAEEQQAWEMIAAWIREVHANAPLAYKDSQSYFAVHQANTRKWFLRFNVQRDPFWVVFRHLSPEQLRQLAPGMEVSEGGALGDAKTALRRFVDFPKLRSAVIAAFEREAARRADQESNGGADPPN